MNSFLLISLIILFISIPTYYITVVYSIYYKKIRKNKDNLKYQYNIKSLGSYIALILLLILTILFCIYCFIMKNNYILILPMIFIDILVFVTINLSCTKFCIFTDYLVVKNNFAEFNELQNIILKSTNKKDIYELQITTKFDLLICKVNTKNPKEYLKEIRTFLPKNIKIKEASAK